MSEHRKYAAVNGQWPDVIPDLEPEEAISAAKRLYRFAMKKPWKGKWKATSGRRYTWPRGSTFYVNPKREAWGDATAGWRDLVHMLSHYAHRQLHPRAKPHAGSHHFLEKEMVEYVIKSGWLDGRLRKKSTPKPDHRDVRRERTAASIKRWETKMKRAETALRKLKKRAAYYERLAA